MTTAGSLLGHCYACHHILGQLLRSELRNCILLVACSLQHVKQVQEHMGLAETFRIGLSLEEPLASWVDVLSITTTYRLIGLKLIRTAGQTTKCKK